MFNVRVRVSSAFSPFLNFGCLVQSKRAVITLVFYKGFSENQSRVALQHTYAVVHSWRYPASNETPEHL